MAQMWRQELHREHLNGQDAAKLHLKLGEYEVAYVRQPEAAILFHKLQIGKLYIPETQRIRCAIWYRQAAAYAGYHAINAKLGIPEEPTYFEKSLPLTGYFPSIPHLKHYCAAESLAVCLRSLHLPYRLKSVLSAIRVTGEGSKLPDLINAAKKLRLSGRIITADETGLKKLPKPLIAWVERDHFVAVVAANNKGVTYLCSSCGSWSGGAVTAVNTWGVNGLLSRNTGASEFYTFDPQSLPSLAA